MKKLLLILFFAAGLFAIWDLYLAEHTLPMRTMLTDSDGNSAEVEILSATYDEVCLRVPSSGLVYDWPMSRLSIISRYKAFRLIHSSEKIAEEKLRNNPSVIQSAKQNERTGTYVQNYQNNIEVNNRRIADLTNQLQDARSRRISAESPLTATERSLMQQIEKLQTENFNYHRHIRNAMENGR